MRTDQKRDVKKYFFLLPNAVFDLGLHVYELAIYTHVTGDMHRRASEIVGGFMEEFMV